MCLACILCTARLVFVGVCEHAIVWFLMGYREAQEGFRWSQRGLLCRRPEADAQGSKLIRACSRHTQQQWPQQAHRKCMDRPAIIYKGTHSYRHGTICDQMGKDLPSVTQV